MFGPAIKRKHRAYQTAVRWGLSCALGTIAASAAAVAVSAAQGHASAESAQAGPLVVALGIAAIADAAVTIFGVPRFIALSLEAGAQPRRWPGVFADAASSASAADRIVARLGMTAFLQLASSFVPSVLGAIACLTGSNVQVFGVFVGLSAVVIAAVFPRMREWDDAIASARSSAALPPTRTSVPVETERG